MGVANDRLGRIGHLTARPRPASAEFAILAGGEWEPRVKTAARPKEFGRDGEVVGGEKGSGPVGRVPLVQVVDEELRCARVWIVRQRIDRATSDHVIASADEPRRQGAEPVRVRLTVVIGKGEVVPTGLRGPGIPCGGGTGVRLSQ